MILRFIFSILYVLASSVAFPSNPQDGAYLDNSERVRLIAPTKNSHRQQEQGEQCSICSGLGSELLSEERPFSYTGATYTCGHLQEKVGTSSSTSDSCKDHIDLYENRCCRQTHQLQNYECVTNVRSSILNDSYDVDAAPVQSFNGTTKALEVETLITYLAVNDLDVVSSALEIFVRVDLKWSDPRLAWNESSTNCATRIKARADHSIKETQIWVPMLDLENRATSIEDFPSSKATVQSDGTVSWSRLGSLRAICPFIGLRKIPFDDLGCRLMFGDDDDDGLSIIDFKLKETSNNLTKGFSHWDGLDIAYEEFSIVDEKSRTSYSSTFPGKFYVDLYFRRARRHYTMFIILPNVLFTYIAFGQFAFETPGGDRLMFSITIVLIIVTQSILTATLLPVCSELLWLNAFNLSSMLFTLFGIMESIIIYGYHMLFLTKEDDTKKDDEEMIGTDEKAEEFVNLIPQDSNNDAEKDGANLNVDTEEGTALASDKKEDFFSRQPSSLAAVSENPQATQTPQSPTSSSSDKEQTTQLSWFGRTRLVKVLKRKSQSDAHLLEKIDVFLFVTLPVTYTIFIIVMFATNSRWEDNQDVRWSSLV